MRRITPICVASTSLSECDFAKPMEYWYSFLENPAWQAQTDTAVSLWVSRAKYQFVFGARVGHFAVTPQSDVVGRWSRNFGVMAMLLVRQKMPFFVHL